MLASVDGWKYTDSLLQRQTNGTNIFAVLILTLRTVGGCLFNGERAVTLHHKKSNTGSKEKKY